MSADHSTTQKTSTAKWRLGALLPLGAALSGVAFAAEPPVETNGNEEQEVVLKDVKVKANRDKTTRFKAETSTTGSKTEMALRDIPQSVSVVKKELIESQNAFNLRDALRNVSGLTIAAGEGGRPATRLPCGVSPPARINIWTASKTTANTIAIPFSSKKPKS
jgi:Outer membrane receptor for ferric coprogen and ferric-rhodotorulic acid